MPKRMGTGASRAEPQVHVVVVQSNEDGSIRAEHVQQGKEKKTYNKE